MIKDENIFKKGEYVVLLSSSDGRNCWSDQLPENYCYKLRLNSTSSNFNVVLDTNGSTTNGWSYDKKTKLKLRAASGREISEYCLLNKPFDVTTLESKITEEENYDYIIPILNRLNKHE